MTEQIKREKKEVDLSICITVLNVKEFARKCLRSIYRSRPKINSEVIVVNDGSEDGTSQMIKQEFPRVRLVENPTNLGFTKANNQALKISRGRYALVLNADTVVLNRALEKMVKFMDAHPDVGMLSGKLLNFDKTLQRCCAKTTPNLLTELLENFFIDRLLNKLFPTWSYPGKFLLTAKEHNEEREVGCISGACMMVRREAVDEVGLFDERFFIYREDSDWSYRFKQSGWKLYYTPEAKIIHYRGQTSRKWEDKGINYFMESYYAYHRKHYGNTSTFLLRCIRIGGAITKIVAFSLQYLLAGNKRRLEEKIDFQWRVLKWHFRMPKG